MTCTMEEETGKLHVLMLPWIEMSHLLPFFELSKRLALKGIHVSFFSNPFSISRLPPIPQTLTPFIKFIPCPPLAKIDYNIYSRSMRAPINQAYDNVQRHLFSFLEDPSRPKLNWIIYDLLAGSWAPGQASFFGINSALFSVFNAAAFSFLGQKIDVDLPDSILQERDFVPFPTNVGFLLSEARRILIEEAESPPRSNQLLLIRTFTEFEARWIDMLGEICSPVPVGFLPPTIDKEEESETWAQIVEWLDDKKEGSVIYADFGSDNCVMEDQMNKIGLGLEKTGLPFVWVLWKCSSPPGFAERTAGRGLVLVGWNPNDRLLAHRAIGGFLTHGGWDSMVEGMAAGAAIVVLPVFYEHGLNARHLVESGFAVEVERNDEDGDFSGEDIARKLKMVMVEEEGEELRMKARTGKEIFGSEKLQDRYIVDLVKILRENQISKPA